MRFRRAVRSERKGFGVRRHDRRLQRTPQVEGLEGRALLSTLTVMNSADNVAGSLRAEIAAAMPGDTIVFASSVDWLDDQSDRRRVGDHQASDDPGIHIQSNHHRCPVPEPGFPRHRTRCGDDQQSHDCPR